MSYTIPAQTYIGHVHLKVADLNKALAFYKDLLGFEITQFYGDSAVFLSAGGYHHHIGLNTWYSKNSGPAPVNTTGLFHTAILYPTKKDLAMILERLMKAGYPLTGTADHGVSIALYLNDPDCKCKGIKDTLLIPSSLIPNPSFEEYVCCPTGLAQLNCSKNWIQASVATSDYYNTCGYKDDPQRGKPPQPLPAGNGYVGFLDIRDYLNCLSTLF